jgi:hypothetical protein
MIGAQVSRLPFVLDMYLFHMQGRAGRLRYTSILVR